MKSRYVASLKGRRDSSGSPIDAALLDLEIAAYLARKGMTQDAEVIVKSVRSQDLPCANSKVVARLNFVEGLLCHIGGLDADAVLKWRRARAIATAEECIDELATVAGWMAFLHYTNGRFDSMIEELRKAFALQRRDSALGSLTARSRMVIALVLHTCRKTQEALHWYEAARDATLSVGDDVELAALVHNMAWIRVYNHRNALLRGEAVAPLEMDISRVSSEAVQSYEELVGLASFPAMTPLLRAQNFMLSEDFSSALSILDEHAKNVRSQGLGRLEPNFNADRAYCLARLGQLDHAEEVIESISRSVDETVHVDDLAVLYSRLRDSARLVGFADLSMSLNDEAWRNWRAFDELTSKLLGEISSVVHADQ